MEYLCNNQIKKKKKLSNVKIISWYDCEAIENIVNKIDFILICVPPSEGKDPFLENFSSLFLNKNFSRKWIGYLSSTSVYGDHKGDWVDESTKLLSTSKLGKNRIDVENDWINCGISSEIISRLVESGKIKFQVKRLGYLFTPCPTTPVLEENFYPNPEKIAKLSYEMVTKKKDWIPKKIKTKQIEEFKGPF